MPWCHNQLEALLPRPSALARTGWTPLFAFFSSNLQSLWLPYLQSTQPNPCPYQRTLLGTLNQSMNSILFFYVFLAFHCWAPNHSAHVLAPNHAKVETNFRIRWFIKRGICILYIRYMKKIYILRRVIAFLWYDQLLDLHTVDLSCSTSQVGRALPFITTWDNNFYRLPNASQHRNNTQWSQTHYEHVPHH